MSQAKSDLEISRLLVAKGLITQNQLTTALEYQCRLPPGQYVLLPQILVDFEFVTEAQIRSALGEEYNAMEDPIAQILIQEGIISSQQLEQAMGVLNAFATQHVVDILVDLGLVSAKQIEQAISNYQLTQSKSTTFSSQSSQKGLEPTKEKTHSETPEKNTVPDTSSPIHLPLGRILMAKGWIRQEELDDALEYQKRLPKVMHKPIGEILMQQGYITPQQLEEALAEQPPKTQNRVGDRLVEAGIIDKAQLAHAMRLQFSPEHAHKKLGVLLLELGYTTREAIEAVLVPGSAPSLPPVAPQVPPKPPAVQPPPSNSPKPLGQILLEKGDINQAQLDAALNFQKQETGKGYRPLGDILVLMGAINETQLQEALADQPAFHQEPIGQILIRQGVIQEWQLAHALCVQHEPGRPHQNLGPLLVELGYTSQEIIEAALIKNLRQKRT